MKRVLKNKAFYVLLGLAIAVIAVNGYVSKLNNFTDEMANYTTDDSSEAVKNYYDLNISDTVPSPTADEVKPQQKPAAAVTVAAAPIADEPAVTVVAKPFALAFPLHGELLSEHSEGELVYNKTMEDWRTHNGIDIAAKIGTAVKAAADGTVVLSAADGLWGWCVTVDHGGGYSTKYCGLQKSDMAKEGQQVKAGDVIGGVGDTTELEIALTPHLHFELISDGESINPLKFIEITETE